jgi:hypothetical protein
VTVIAAMKPIDENPTERRSPSIFLISEIIQKG